MKNEHNTLAVLKRRLRRQRGVAMVEGAIIFPLMAMFMFFLELAHHSFDGYITATHVARERAWSSATIGSATGQCGAGRDDDAYWPKAKYIKSMTDSPQGADGVAQKGAPPDTGSSGVSAGQGSGGHNGFFKHTATATAHITIDRGGHLFQPTAVSKVSVYCNQPYIGGVETVISNAFHK